MLASRLSTASNLGRLETPAQQYEMVKGNLMLMQVQAIIVALAASLFSIVMGVVFHHEFSLRDSLLIAASAISTASIASIVLGWVGGGDALTGYCAHQLLLSPAIALHVARLRPFDLEN